MSLDDKANPPRGRVRALPMEPGGLSAIGSSVRRERGRIATALPSREDRPESPVGRGSGGSGRRNGRLRRPYAGTSGGGLQPSPSPIPSPILGEGGRPDVA